MQQESNIYFHHPDMKNKVSDSSTMAHINKKKMHFHVRIHHILLLSYAGAPSPSSAMELIENITLS